MSTTDESSFFKVLDLCTSFYEYEPFLSENKVPPAEQSDWGLSEIIRGQPICGIQPDAVQIQAAAKEWQHRTTLEDDGADAFDLKGWAKECQNRVNELLNLQG